MKRTLRHPIRGDRLHPKPSMRPAKHASWRGNTRGPRMRPRKSVNVASIVGSPEEEDARPNLRLRIVGIVVLLLFGVLVLRLWTLQVVEGKSYAAAVTRNQVRVVSVAAPHERAGTLSIVFIVSYIALGVPAIIAGSMVRHASLLATAQVFGAVVMALAAAALVAGVSTSSYRAQARAAARRC